MAAVAEQTRGGGRHDVARFLTEHEPCGSDFEIRRFSGPGRGNLNVVCNGCGERAAYELGRPGELTPVASADAPDGGRRLSREEIERWLPAPAALPWWIPNAYILVVIVVGLAMIAFGVLRNQESEHLFDGRGSDSDPAEEASGEPVSEPPRAAQAGAGAQQPDQDRSDAGRTGIRRDRPDLDRVTVLSRFEIGVPGGWVGTMSGGAVVFRSAAGDAELRVFLERGAEERRRLSRKARKFLRDAHPGAKITKAERLELGGARAVRLGAKYRGGEEWATVLTESGYSYLLLSRLGSSTPGSVKREAEAAVASFQAL